MTCNLTETTPVAQASDVPFPLGRVEETDVRNNLFPMSVLVGDKPVRSYTWRMPHILDQSTLGDAGSCTGHGACYDVLAPPKKYRLSLNQAHRLAQIIYYDAQRNDQWPGGEYPGASPRMAGSSTLQTFKAMQRLGLITEYRWANSVMDLARGVGSVGPALIGIGWTEEMFYPGVNGRLDDGGSTAGGHLTVVAAVNNRRRVFRGPNSWGAGWGDDGWWEMSFDMMERRLADRGEAGFATERVFQRDWATVL